MTENIETVVEKARAHIAPVLSKLGRMQEIYLTRKGGVYSDSHVDQIRKSFEAVQYKYLFTFIHLEQLWGLSMESRFGLLDALANSLDSLKWDETQSVIGSLFMESFFFQAMSLLDVYRFYICLITGIEDPGLMTASKFSKRMKSRNGTPFQAKAEKIRDYFEKEVFGTGQWGKLLEELRDKIAHRDHLWPSYEGWETLLDKVLLDWPTLRGKTYDRFCQDIDNGIFDMFCKTSPLLFELKWKSGPHRDNLWEEDEKPQK